MYRTNTCGELRLADSGKDVTLAGWVQRVRKMGGMTFIDVRDRYGITQIVFDESADASLCSAANKLGREFCVQIKGVVSERHSKNDKITSALWRRSYENWRFYLYKMFRIKKISN